MNNKNKFGFAPVDPTPEKPARQRSVGPMGAAVRDAADSLQVSTAEKVEQRRRNVEDAQLFRTAQEEGRVLVLIPLQEIATDDLPRDRLDLEGVAVSEEMEELKTSIRDRGQKEPVEVYKDAEGHFQLKKGWRRFTALSQLFHETGEAGFSTIIARVEAGGADRITRYVDMVEENVVRQDLTFAEMAAVAIEAAKDGDVDEIDPAELVNRLYAALHKTKRSYIRNFVFLLSVLGDSLKWPKEVPRNLGVDVARAMSNPEAVEGLKADLMSCTTSDAQTRALKGFVSGTSRAQPGAKTPKQKFEFFVGDAKVTARDGECRLVSEVDFASLPKENLEAAVRAFYAEIGGGPRIR